MAKKEKEEINTDFKEVLANLRTDIKLTRIMLASFTFIAIFLRLFLKIPIPFSILIILFIWFLSYFFYPRLLTRKKTSSELYNFYFKCCFLDLLFLTSIIHYLGSAEWIGVIFYLLTLGSAGTVLPKKKSLLLSLTAAFLYSNLVLLEYFQVLPHRTFFVLRPGLYQEPVYVFSQILIIAAFFFFIGETSGTFSKQLKEKQKQLIKERKKTIKAYREVEEARKILEIRVRARTEELQGLTESQEGIIRERTKEIQEKLEELEKFQRLTVGRELKMIELKEEIRKLKKS